MSKIKVYKNGNLWIVRRPTGFGPEWYFYTTFKGAIELVGRFLSDSWLKGECITFKGRTHTVKVPMRSDGRPGTA